MAPDETATGRTVDTTERGTRMSARVRTTVAAVLTAMVWAGLAPASAAEDQAGDGVRETIEEALDADLGMSMAEFVRAGARAEQAGPRIAAGGDVAVGALTATGSVEVLGDEDGTAGTEGFATLEDLRDRYLAEVGGEGLTGLAYTADGYEILVVDPERAYDRGAGAATSADVPSPAEWAARFPGVGVTATDGPGQAGATLRGGAPVAFGSVGCTHGFNGWSGATEVGISAGHCPFLGGTRVAAGSYVGTVDWYQFGAPGSALESYGTDLTTYPFGSAYSYPPSITTYSSTVTITGRAAAVIGMPVCKTGRRTGWTCSTVNKIGWQWIGDGSGDITRPKRWVWSLFADTRVIPGDSGGPWVSGHKAVGVTSSYDSYADGRPYSTAALLTSLDDYRPAAQVKMWLGGVRVPSAEYSDTDVARARWAEGSTVSGSVRRLSGDLVSPGTVAQVRLDGTLTTSAPVSPDGTFSFTYTGSDDARHEVTVRAVNRSSRGPVTTVTDEPAGTAPEVRRHAGANRYDTAARIALDTFGPGTGTVYVASGSDFPDALAGGALAGADGAPVLLTRRSSLPDETRAALSTLRPGRIVVLGGTAAVSGAVQAELAGLALAVERISGENRYATAAQVAAAFATPGGKVFVASGRSFPDGLAAAARAGSLGVPVLLTGRDELPAATVDELQRLAPSEIVVVGGTAAVGDDVAAALATHAPVRRLAGDDRYQTAARVARAFPGPSAAAWVASGASYPDALAAGPAAALADAPVVLTMGAGLPAATRSALLHLRPPTVAVAGGSSAVSTEVFDDLRWLTYR